MKKTLLLAFSMLSLGAFAQPNLAKGLVAYYSMNWNTQDISGFNNHGTPVGVTLDTAQNGVHDGAYRFTMGSRIKVETNSALNLIAYDSLTMSISFYATSFNAPLSNLLSFYKQGGIELQILGSGANTGKLRVLNFNGNTMTTQFDLITNGVVALNQWNHVFVEMVQSDSSTKVYLNNAVCGSIKNKIFSLPNAGLVIGNHLTENWHLNGKVDEVRVYNRLLSDTERGLVSGQIPNGIAGVKATPNSIMVYPNPTSGMVTVHSNNTQNIERLVVSDLAGKVVFSSSYQEQLNLSELNKGIYILQARTQKGEILENQRVVLY